MGLRSQEAIYSNVWPIFLTTVLQRGLTPNKRTSEHQIQSFLISYPLHSIISFDFSQISSINVRLFWLFIWRSSLSLLSTKDRWQSLYKRPVCRLHRTVNFPMIKLQIARIDRSWSRLVDHQNRLYTYPGHFPPRKYYRRKLSLYRHFYTFAVVQSATKPLGWSVRIARFQFHPSHLPNI